MRVPLLCQPVLAVCLPVLTLSAQSADFDFHDLAHHYATVEAELRAATLPRDPAIAARRLAAIDLLHEYRVRGNFGDDPSGSGTRNAKFVDDAGRRCAVAFLLDRTGHANLTDAIAARSNDAWVVELAGDEALQNWLLAHGITAVEAARIQGPGAGAPRSNNNPLPPPPPPAPLRIATGVSDANTRDPAATGWRPGTRDATPQQASAGGPSGATAPTARATAGIPIASLPAPEWSLWWEWNRDRFEPPAKAPEDDSAATRVRIVTREQAVDALRALAEHAQADVRAAANQALGRMQALDAAAAIARADAVREVRLRTLTTLPSTPDLKLLHRLAKDTLTKLGGEDALVALAACASSESDRLLGMLEPRLVDDFSATSPDTVAAAAMAAATGHKPRLRERARSIVRDDGESWRRSLLAGALASAADAEDVAALTIALGARNPGVRRAAAIALGRSRAELALPVLFTAYELEHEQSVRGALLLAIGDHGGAGSLHFLQKEVLGAPRALRVLAAIGIGMWAHEREDDDETPRLLDAMLADHNHDHTGGYLLALGLTGDARARTELLRALSAASTSSARGAAANALGLLGDPTAIEPLAVAADGDSCPWVRSECMRALGRLGHDAADELGEFLRNEPNPEVRRAAALALGDLGSPTAAAALVAAARDASTPAAVLVGVASGLGRHFRRSEPQLPAVRAAMDPQSVPPLIAWVATQDL